MIRSKPFSFLISFFSVAIVAFSTGCMSGGFKLTRQYARWVNSQMIVLRIVLYIVTLPIYAVTMLVDAVIFNTMDFWNGTVAAGAYEFKKDDKTYFVNHEFQPGTLLKKSIIDVRDTNSKLVQTVVIKETAANEIELWVNGKLRSKVKDLESFPIATIFEADGMIDRQEAPLMVTAPNAYQAIAHR